VSQRVAAAVLSLLAAPLAAEPLREDASAPALTLVWYDPTGIAWGTELVARAEAAALLRRLGASVSWRRGASRDVSGNDEVWVILVDAGPPQPTGALVLGAARKRPSAVRTLWVRVPNVRAAAGVAPGRPLRVLPPGEQRVVAVALGRVIAHEVVHALVPSLPHGTGLMSGSLTRRQLTAGSIAVEPEAILAFRAALRGDPVLPTGGVERLAAGLVPEKDR
jgi:hypothetical protein